MAILNIKYILYSWKVFTKNIDLKENLYGLKYN